MNTYLYANANSNKYTDPFGLDTTGGSPNPNRPKPKAPGYSSVICAGVNAVCEEREEQERLEDERHENNHGKGVSTLLPIPLNPITR